MTFNQIVHAIAPSSTCMVTTKSFGFMCEHVLISVCLYFKHQMAQIPFPVADLEGGPRGPGPPPPFLTQVYNVYHFEGQRINNVT